MAYTAVYGPYSSGWYPSGSDVQRKIRARMYYETEETPTQFIIRYYLQMTLYKDNAGYTFSARLYNAGTQIATGSRTYTYNKNNSNHTEVYYTIIGTQTVTINKTQSAQSRTISGKVYRNSYEGTYYSTASVTLTIPALVGYNVTYDANGGEGAPANQLKVETVPLTLSSTVPTRTGYTFANWNTKADGSGTSYSPSGTYSAEAELLLYAQWTPNTYTVAYDKNNTSATGTTANSTFTYDVTGTLRANGYSLTDYLFAGWALSSTGAVVYTNGQSVKNLIPSGTLTLYAKWKYQYEEPDIQLVTAYRWNVAEGEADDAGEAGRVEVFVMPAYKYSNLTTKAYVSTQVIVSYRISGSGSSYTQLGSVQTITAPSTLIWTSGASTFDASKQYDILVTARITERNAVSVTSSTFISVAEFILDFDGDGESIGLFHVAEGATPSGEKIVGIEGDIVFYLDDTSASGTDYEIITALTALGWDVTPS